MDKYINVLVKHGYTHESATRLCIDFMRNLSLFDLECFITFVGCTDVD